MRWRWANRRARRSYSTARLTCPETQRRTTPKAMRATTTIATTSHTSGGERAAVAAAQHVVDHPSGQVWQGDGARHQPRCAECGDGHPAGVGPQEAQQASEDSQGDSLVNDREGHRTAQGRAALVDDALPEPPRHPEAYAVPNVSEGRDPHTIQALVDACRVPRVRVLDVHSDPDHHRSVITLTGESIAVQDALVSLAGECVDRIDLRRHRGAHPRIGALDVAPIVAIDDDDEPLATEVATRARAAASAPTSTCPSSSTARVATDPERTRPTRLPPRWAWRSWSGPIDEGELVPDAGPHRLHPTRRRGARGRAPAADRAERLAPGGHAHRRPRHRGPGPRDRAAARPACAPSGSTCPEAGMAQVSMNIEDHRAATAGAGDPGRAHRGRAPRHRGRRGRAGGADPARRPAGRARARRPSASTASGRAWSSTCTGAADGQAQEAQERGPAAGHRAQAPGRGRRGSGGGGQAGDDQAPSGRAGRAVVPGRAPARRAGHRRASTSTSSSPRGRSRGRPCLVCAFAFALMLPLGLLSRPLPLQAPDAPGGRRKRAARTPGK